MKKLLIVIAILSIYATSVFYCKAWISSATSPTGMYPHLIPDYGDVFICFVPGVNTCFAVEYFIDGGKDINDKPSFFK